ncbi:MAG: hypothetical protein U0Q16_02585 [Bryobacteraceae bacterium]
MFRKVIDGVVDRLTYHVTTYVPSFLVALILILGAAVTAPGARRLIYRILKGRTIDRFLRTSGVAREAVVRFCSPELGRFTPASPVPIRSDSPIQKELISYR